MTTLNLRGSRISPLLLLTLGLAVGWTLSVVRTPALHAQRGDRSDESVLVTGPAYIKYNDGSKVQVAQDAIYFLDYRAGKLLTTIPTHQQTAAGTKIIDGFVERDLVADFKIDLDTAATPHFLMTTCSSVNAASSSFGDGGALLLVFETTTRQYAAYRVSQLNVGLAAERKLEMLQLGSYRPGAAGSPR
jgi:hypothetical protein